MPTLKLLSSMATRELLAELLARRAQAGVDVGAEAAGGVDVVRRVQGGEPVDVVILASKAIDQLIGADRLRPGRVDLARSGVGVAVRAGAPAPDISSEDAVRRAVLAARTLSYSTGPSGVHLEQLFARWGVFGELKPRIVVPPAGMPVAALIAAGAVELGFQQLSELMNVPDVQLLGPLPTAIQTLTVFSGAVAVTSREPDAAQALLAHLASPATADAKRRHGMAPI
jgi:molybdate transport system substrate-binding protein